MRRIQQANAVALAALLLAACAKSPAPDAGATADGPAGPAPTATTATDDADTLRSRAGRAMQDARFFAPAGDNALEHYLRLREQAPADASVGSALEDLQPQLVIAIELAIARADAPESRRLLAMLARMDAGAPALPRLQATVASADAVARERALAVDAEARESAGRAEAELRRLAQESAVRLAAERTATVGRPASSGAPPPSAPAQAAPTLPVAAAPRIATEAPVRSVPPQAAAVAAPRPLPASPVQAVAAPTPQAAPKLLRDVAPRYPDGGGRNRQSGQVQVAFTINPQGGVESPRVVTSDLPTAFDRAALAAAARWRFEATGSTQPGSRTVRFDPPGG